MTAKTTLAKFSIGDFYILFTLILFGFSMITMTSITLLISLILAVVYIPLSIYSRRYKRKYMNNERNRWGDLK